MPPDPDICVSKSKDGETRVLCFTFLRHLLSDKLKVLKSQGANATRYSKCEGHTYCDSEMAAVSFTLYCTSLQ